MFDGMACDVSETVFSEVVRVIPIQVCTVMLVCGACDHIRR